MKKILLMTAVAVFGFSNMHAQELSFGVKAGVNFANLSGDIEDNDMLIGFHVGGVAEYMFDEKLGLQAELLYSAQGSKTSYSSTETIMGSTISIESEDKWKLNYINIPVLFKYYVTEGLSIEAGPQVGILVSAELEEETKTRVETNGTDTTTSESRKTDMKDFISSVDYGLNFGLGYKMESGLNFGARYNLGLSNVLDVDGSNEKVNNGVIQVSVGFMF